MARFSFLVPRCTIVILLMTAVWLGKDVILRRYFVGQLETTLGTKVELAQLQTNFKTGRICLKDLKIVDPEFGLNNLLQADMAYLKIDSEEFWKRKFVVTEGQANGLRFNAPRTESVGRMATGTSTDPQESLDRFAKTDAQLDLAIEKIGKRLLDRTTPGSVNVAEPKLQLESISREILERWKNDLALMESHARELAPALEKMKETVAHQHKYFHALRDNQQIQGALHEIDSLQAKAVDLKTRINRALEQFVADQKAIQQATDRDFQTIGDFRFENQLDEQLISELLLSRESEELVDEVLTWINWFHNAVPGIRMDADGKRSGTSGKFQSLEFALPKPIPSRGIDWSFKKIDLDGSGWLANHHLNFVGTAYNLSALPNEANEPTRFELRALGKNNLLINCLVDRSGQEVLTNIKIQFQDMELGRKPMGEPGTMLISTGSHRRADAEVDLEIKGVAVTGKVELRYSGVALHLDSFSDVLGGPPAQLHLNQGLGRINHFQSTLELNGTVENLTMKLKSDLGSQVQELFGSVVANRFAQEKEKYRQRIQNSDVASRQFLEQLISPKLIQINEMMADEINRIAEIKESVSPIGESGWTKLR